MKQFLIIIMLLAAFITKAQSYYKYQVKNGDTLVLINLPTIVIGHDYTKPPVFKNKREKKRYNWLTHYVKKVYPYATLAAAKLNEYKGELDTASLWRKRQIMKQVEKALIAKYGKEMKNLTVTQGRILLKLIDRQTGATTFEVVKELRGGMSATMWQGVALIFGGNLKSTYDPKGKDWMIEDIVRKIEMGLI